MAKEHVDARSWKCPEKHQGLGGLTGFLLKVGRALGHHRGHGGPEAGLSAKLISRAVPNTGPWRTLDNRKHS